MMVESFFFFQAEDGIRDSSVTGVQTCALPIFSLLGGRISTSTRNIRKPLPQKRPRRSLMIEQLETRLAPTVSVTAATGGSAISADWNTTNGTEIGRASCRERV